MRVFITGATGFIGSAIIPQLLQAGHQVLGLSRSEEGARALSRLGAQAHAGSLEDLASLKAGAAQADAVIHAGFIHDFSKFKDNCEVDARAIDALGDAMAGTGRRLIVTAGVGFPAPGRVRTEEDAPEAPSDRMPRVSEQTGEAQRAKGVHVCTVRLPQVHDPMRQGLVTYAIALAREKGVSAYLGEGRNRWSAVHRDAAAQVYRLALERGESGARYHAVDEEGVPFKAIAESIGRGLKLPVVSVPPSEAAAHFGWMAGFASVDMPATSVLTQQRLGWAPFGPSLIDDLDRAEYLKDFPAA